ncbi:MAG: hypothetical protein KIT83_05540 [Bryobacterales bacterium]|nr:hypothetical protein [Bryobacterales bacterium]
MSCPWFSLPIRHLISLAAALAIAAPLVAQMRPFAIERAEGITARKVAISSQRYEGSDALHVAEPAGQGDTSEDKLAILDGIAFRNGTVELELASRPGPGANPGARGFVGLAFRVAEDASSFECIYLRPTNGRSSDQERRNHSTQYISFPAHPWHLLRKETPSRYESYVDLEPGAWTKVKITVQGNEAKLFVHGVEQPALIVNDLKLGEREGRIALWIGPGTLAWFRNLRVTPAP